MAETFGSMIDKLSIKSIREFYLEKMIQSGGRSSPVPELKRKLEILRRQKRSLLDEINGFLEAAARRRVVLRDEKLKLYNKSDVMGRIGIIDSAAKGISELTKKNMELWRLEDEARREDVPLSHIGRTKKKIDVANQQRNDLIDRIDELLSEQMQKSRSRRKV
jgi:hypothetical protein